MNRDKFSKLALVLEKKGFKKIPESEEIIEYSLWDSPYRGKHGFPKITRNLRSGEQTFRILIPDKPDWLKSHWEIKIISSKKKEEVKLKKLGYTKIRDMVLHLAEFVKDFNTIRLHEVKNRGIFISITGKINKALIYRILGIKKFSGDYDDFIFGKPGKAWKELDSNKHRINELCKKWSKRKIFIKRITNKILLVSGKAPDGVGVRFFLNVD